MKKKILLLSLIFSLSLNIHPKIKKPDVSGKFYPQTKKEILNLFKTYNSKISPPTIKGKIKIAISPHAGYFYSGKTAYTTYKTLKLNQPDIKNFIILAPSHFYPFNGFALWDKGEFETPLGNLKVNSKISSLIKSKLSSAKFIYDYYKNEHAVETQLPFIKYFWKNAKIIPIVIGFPQKNQLKKLSSILSEILKTHPNTVITVSTDMSHYHKKDVARKIDMNTVRLISSYKPETFFRAISLKTAEMCGWRGVYVSMLIAKNLGYYFKVLYYTDSSEASGIVNSVVGYLSAVFFEPPKKNSSSISLNKDEKNELLKIARYTISYYFSHGKIPEIKPKNKKLYKKYGVFVTLKKYGLLRGCIGILRPIYPLYLAVEKAAISSAFSDPRFPPLKKDELKKVKIEISVLSDFYKISSIKEIKVGRDGLLIINPHGSGLLLPQVAKEYGWNKFEFLSHTCNKAGLSDDCWKKRETTIYRFEAFVFGEK